MRYWRWRIGQVVAVTVLVLGVLGVLGGCKKTETPTDPKKELTAEEKAKGQKMWAELLGMKGVKGKAGLGKQATTLRGVVSQFTSYETCLSRLEKSMPPDLGMDLLSHYNIPDALCRTREALSKKQASICKQITSYSMKKGCQIMYAAYNKRPDDCPLSYRARQGRDGYCLALASRNASLCVAGRSEQEDTRCRAILKGEPEACERLTRHSQRQSCKGEVGRWKGEMDGATATLPKDFVPKLRMDLKIEGGGRSIPYRYQRVEPNCVFKGAVAPSSGDSEHVNFCDYRTYGYYRRGSSYSSGVYRYAKVDFSFKPPSSPTEVIRFGTDAKFGIKITGFGEYASSPQGEIKFTAFERKRGGRVAGTFKVTVMGAGNRLAVAGTFDSFVRDLVDPSQMRRGYRYSGGLSSLGSRYGKGSGAGVLGSLGSRYGKGGLGLGGSRYGSGSGIGKRSGSNKRFAALLTAASLTRVTAGGKTGFQLASILPNSIWDRLGLRDGDVVLQIGKVKLTNKRDVVRARDELRNAKPMTIRLKRDKRNKSLRIGQVAMDRLHQEFYF